MMQDPEVSVVMSCFNEEIHVGRAIQSILDQSFQNFEFIIVDDGSSDETSEIIKDYQGKDERIVFIQNEKNLGLSASLNRGIANAKGFYIARMDADDISLPERLKDQLDFLRSNPQIDVLGTAIKIKSDTSKDIIKRCPEAHGAIAKRLFRKPLLFHPTVVIKKEVFLKYGKYDENIKWAEDADLWYRIIDNVTFHNLQKPYLVYSVKNKFTFYQLKNNLKVKIRNLKRRGVFIKYLPQLLMDLIIMSAKMVKYRF